MGTDDLFKKKKAQLKSRESGNREPKPDSFLIITEGKQTEPNYFNGLADYINKRFGKSIDVEMPTIEAQGEGKCTVSLVNAAAQIATRSKILYSETWVLFDKDDFDDFDEAVELCKSYRFCPGWSNQCFEFWLLLHFVYCDAALHRTVIFEKLNQIFKDYKICETGYNKNNKDLFEHVTSYGSIKKAVRYAERIDMQYAENTPPSKCDPCTKVYILIQKLERWLQDLN